MRVREEFEFFQENRNKFLERSGKRIECDVIILKIVRTKAYDQYYLIIQATTSDKEINLEVIETSLQDLEKNFMSNLRKALKS